MTYVTFDVIALNLTALITPLNIHQPYIYSQDPCFIGFYIRNYFILFASTVVNVYELVVVEQEPVLYKSFRRMDILIPLRVDELTVISLPDMALTAFIKDVCFKARMNIDYRYNGCNILQNWFFICQSAG